MVNATASNRLAGPPYDCCIVMARFSRKIGTHSCSQSWEFSSIAKFPHCPASYGGPEGHLLYHCWCIHARHCSTPSAIFSVQLHVGLCISKRQDCSYKPVGCAFPRVSFNQKFLCSRLARLCKYRFCKLVAILRLETLQDTIASVHRAPHPPPKRKHACIPTKQDKKGGQIFSIK